MVSYQYRYYKKKHVLLVIMFAILYTYNKRKEHYEKNIVSIVIIHEFLCY